MSEFLGEARIVVRPDTTRFRAELQEQVARAISQTTIPAVQIPVAVGGALGAVTAQTAALAAAQQTTAQSTLGLASAAQVENSALGRQAVLLETVTAATAQKAGADLAAAGATSAHATAQGDVRRGAIASLASLTGLRGAVLAASTGFLAATIAVQAFAKSVQNFAEFQRILSVFRVTAGATADEIRRVAEEAERLGQDISLPGVTAADAARAMQELAKAGLSVEDSLAGARGVLQLSTAASIDQAAAAELAATALNSFNLAGNQATRVADVLANAANSAQGSIEDFGLAFRQSSAVANQVGLSLEETATQLSILAQAGLRGSDAGTSLRVALLRLIAPTKEAAAIIKQLGIDLRDAQGNIRPDVFVQFGEATESFTKAQRDAAFAAVFGADAIRTVSIAASAGRDDLLEMTSQISRQGSAAELAGAQTAGLSGQLEALSNQVSTASVEFGKLAAIVAGPVVLAFGTLIGPIARALELTGDLTDKIGDLARGAVGLKSGFDPASASAADFVRQLQELREEREKLLSQELGDAFTEVENIKVEKQIRATIEALRTQRAELEALGASTTGVDQLIATLRKELRGLGATAASVNLTPAEKAIERLRDLIEEAGKAGFDTTALEVSLARLERDLASTSDRAFEHGRGIGRNVAAGLEASIPDVIKASAALNTSLDIALAQAAGDEGGELEGLRERERRQQAFLDRILSRPQDAQSVALATKAAENLAATRRQIEAILSTQASETRKVSQDAERAQREAEQGLLSLLSDRRGDAERKIAAATTTAGVQDDIRAQDRLQALIKIQIDKIRDRVKDEQTRKDAIRELRIALIASRREEDALRAQQAQDVAVAKQTSIELDIAFAETTNNVSREIVARQRLIALLKKQQATVKKGTNEWKRLRNEIAEQQAAIKEAKKQDQETSKEGRSFAQDTFEFLQAQQGFAANVFGNLIPGFATTGLVGNQNQTQTPVDLNIQRAAGMQEAKLGAGPTAGHANATNHLLAQILQALKALNRSADAPEAIYQRRVGSAAMDGAGGGTLDSVAQ